jgi:hypothetical protein
VSGHLHCDTLRDAGADQVPDCGPSEIVNNAGGNAGLSASCLPGAAEISDWFSIAMKYPRADHVFFLQGFGIRSLRFKDSPQFLSEGKYTGFIVLRCAGFQANESGLKIHPRPLEVENFAYAPSGDVSEGGDRLQGFRQVDPD